MKKLLIVLIAFSLQLKAQQIDTLEKKLVYENNFDNSHRYQSYILPAAFITYGIVSLGNNSIRNLDLNIRDELNQNHPNFTTKADNFLQFAPLAAVYGLDLIGVKSRSSVLDQTGMILLSNLITTALVTPLKYSTGRLRPNGSANNSFPSGHTATAFAAAELFSQEFKHESSWYSYAGYAVATTTGILRMYNNKHWLSDVVAGAGFGILSTKITYLVYPHLKRLFVFKQRDMTAIPVYQNGVFGLSFKYKPKRT